MSENLTEETEAAAVIPGARPGGRRKRSPNGINAARITAEQRAGNTPTNMRDYVAPVIEPPAPTQAQIDEYLKRTGMVAVAIEPTQPAMAVPEPTRSRAETARAMFAESPPVVVKPTNVQRTTREAVALPMDEGMDIFLLRGSPDYDYVRVQTDDHEAFRGNNERGVSYYRSIGYGRVDMTGRDEQEVILELHDGTREPVRKGMILMARHKSVGIREREEERLKNDPRRDSPDDVYLTSKPGGHFYEEERAIKRSDIPNVLPDRNPNADLDDAYRHVAHNPLASEKLADLARSAEQSSLTDD